MNQEELDALVVVAAKERHAAWLALVKNTSPAAHKRYELSGTALDNACERATGGTRVFGERGPK